MCRNARNRRTSTTVAVVDERFGAIAPPSNLDKANHSVGPHGRLSSRSIDLPHQLRLPFSHAVTANETPAWSKRIVIGSGFAVRCTRPGALGHCMSRRARSTAMTSVFIGTEIPVAMVMLLVVAAVIVIVASWDEHAATERCKEDRKNEDVFHVVSRLDMIDWINTRLWSFEGC